MGATVESFEPGSEVLYRGKAWIVVRNTAADPQLANRVPLFPLYGSDGFLTWAKPEEVTQVDEGSNGEVHADRRG